MRRFGIAAMVLALLVATPVTASALPDAATGSRQQIIKSVIERGLAQRGVPYSYGGGNADGPSAGTGSTSDTAPATLGSAPAALGSAPATAPDSVPVFGQVPTTATTAPAPPAPKVVGFDSSGLVVYAFAGAGIKLPRSSGEQYKVGRKILPSQALPGDLIFYGPDGSQSVALFVGNGQMLEATPPAVVVSPVRTDGMAPYLSRIIEWQ